MVFCGFAYEEQEKLNALSREEWQVFEAGGELSLDLLAQVGGSESH